jgi:hypothetical protein
MGISAALVQRINAAYQNLESKRPEAIRLRAQLFNDDEI